MELCHRIIEQKKIKADEVELSGFDRFNGQKLATTRSAIEDNFRPSFEEHVDQAKLRFSLDKPYSKLVKL